jgi:sec-independent protein translocase protein TatA
MIGDILQPTHLLFVLVVALLVLGPKRLPEAGRALGKGIRDFRTAISGDEDHSSGLHTEAAPVPPPEATFPPAATPSVETIPGPTDTTAERSETVHPVG